MAHASAPIDIPPTASGGIARRAVARCREAEIDLEPLLRKAGLTAGEIDNTQARLGAVKQIALLNLAADALDDELLGFHLATAVDLREASLVYFVLASSSTFREALDRAGRYSTVANESLRLERLTGEQVGIRFSCLVIPRHTDRHQVEFWATVLVRIARQLTETRSAPARVSLVHPRCGASGEMETYFGCPISFSADEDVVTFSRSMGDRPVVGADPYLHEYAPRSKSFPCRDR